VEVIVKRALVYAAVLSAVVAMYVVLLKVVQRMFDQGSAGHEWVIAFLATLVAVLLAPPVKDFVQTGSRTVTGSVERDPDATSDKATWTWSSS